MRITESIEHNITVLLVEGRLDATSAPEAENVFRSTAQKTPPKLLLDLTGVEYISSGGLRSVIMLMKMVRQYQGVLSLCGMGPFVSEVFDITHLADQFTIYPSRTDALAAMNA